MDDKVAFERAMHAIRKAHDDSEAFGNGSMASWEVMAELEGKLRAEFNQPEKENKGLL